MSVPETTRRKTWLYASAVVFVALVAASNLLTSRLGLVTVGPLVVAAGTFTAGLVLLARDVVHDYGRVPWVAGCIAVGAVISAVGANPRIAAASAAAFALSELLDLAVYVKIRERHGFTAGSITSNTAGAVADSILFLWLAGFPIWSALPGQVIVKVTLSTVAVLGVRRALLRDPVDSVSA